MAAEAEDALLFNDMMMSSVISDPTNLGLEIHLKGQQGLQNMRSCFECQFTWITEALVEAKKTFSSPEIRMIPKTPSATQSRRRSRIIEENEPKPKKRNTKNSAKAKENKSQDESVTSENTESSETEGSEFDSARSMRSTRSTRSTRAKPPPKPASARQTRSSRRNKGEESVSQNPEPILTAQELCFVKEDQEGKDDVDQDVVNKQEVVNATIVLLSSEDDLVSDEEMASPPTKSQRKSSFDGCVPRQRSSVADSSMRDSEKESPETPDETDGEALLNDRVLKVREKAIQFEAMAARSSGSLDTPPTPRTPRSRQATPIALNHSQTASPHRAPSTGSGTATPPTIVKPVVSRTTPKLTTTGLSAAKQAFETLLGAKAMSPQVSAPKELRRSGRQRSCRVSGSKLSLSKRRSSTRRRKSAQRSSIDKTQESSHLDTIKAQLLTASSHNARCGSPVRSTRSKMRVAVPKPQTPEKVPRSKLHLSRFQHLAGSSPIVTSSAASSDEKSQSPQRHNTRSKMRVNKVPPRLAVTSDSDCGTPPDAGFVASPATVAPTRSTRSKIRKQQEADPMGSPFKAKCLEPKSDFESPFKRQCMNNAYNHHDDESKADFSSPRMGQPIHPQSFLHKKNRMTPNNLNTTTGSFLRTQAKVTGLNVIELKRKQMLAKEEQARNRRLKVQEEQQRQAEEKRKNRQQKQLQAAQRRKEQELKEEEAKERELQREKEKLLYKAKMLEQKQREEKVKLKQREIKLEVVRKKEIEKRREREQQIREQEMEKQRQLEYQQRKREFEQQQRQKQLQEQRQKHEERQTELERERQREIERLRHRQKEEEIRLKEKEERDRKEKIEREKQEVERLREREKQKQIDLEKQREKERQLFKEERTKLEEESKAKEEEKRLQKMIEKHNNALKQNTSHNTSQKASHNTSYNPNQPSTVQYNKSITAHTMDKETAPTLNSTFSKDDSQTSCNTAPNHNNPDSYDMTPVRRVYKKASADNYNIHDMKSDDSTDDEETPRNKIPTWATGPQLRASLITQFYTPPDIDKIFNIIDAPDLCKMFSKKKPKFFKRTSSACWSSPVYLPSGKPQIEHTN